MGNYSFSVRDRSDELSAVSIRIGAVTAATLPGYLTSTGAFRDATDALVLGVIAKDEMKVFSNQLDAARPTSPWANRETKLLVRYKDITENFSAIEGVVPNEGFGKAFSLEIPTPDLSLTGLLIDGSDFVNVSQTQIAAWVNAFEAVAVSPYNGNVEVQSIEVVGRRN